jgi:hypothetical protein
MNTRSLIALLPLALLVACGGGGGGDGASSGNTGSGNGVVAAANGQAGVAGAADQTVSALAFPVAASLVALASTPYGYTKTYRDPANNVHTLVGEYKPGSVLPFEGVSANAGFAVSSRSKNGTLVSIRTQVDYYQTGTYLYLGSVDNNGEFIVASNQVQAPATAKVGQKGSLYSLTGFENHTKATILYTGTSTWELHADTGSTANFCITSHLKYQDGRSEKISTACNKITGNGLQNGSNITLTAEGKTETFTD